MQSAFSVIGSIKNEIEVYCLNMNEKARAQLREKNRNNLPFLHLFRYTNKTVPMLQSETMYIYFVLDGEFSPMDFANVVQSSQGSK